MKEISYAYKLKVSAMKFFDRKLKLVMHTS